MIKKLLLGLTTWLVLSLSLAAQEVRIRRAAEVEMPRPIDSNSPAFWRDGRLHWFNSQGHPDLSIGPDQFGPWQLRQVELEDPADQPHWLESVSADPNGTLWAWYHAEPVGLFPDSTLTAPKIGAVVSSDGGLTLRNLGTVLESGDPLDPTARNGYFAGGHGDFSVILDRERRYFYFLFDNYGGATATQGVCIARMAYADRHDPVGKVWKFHDGAWREAGLGGRVTPIFPVVKRWQASDPDALWGPSVHWNTYLNCYVMLMSHAAGEPGWSQQGIYVSFCADLSKPDTWTTPRKILDKSEFSGWYYFYPQVMGLERDGTDTLAGQVARLYVSGTSRWEIEFIAPAIAPTALAVTATTPTTVPTGGTVALTVTGMGQPPFTYQWFKDGEAIPGATHATLTLAAATVSDSGNYTAMVANALGAATSRAVAVKVEPPPPPPPPQPFVVISNLSILSYLTDERAALAFGFAVRTPAKQVVLRALGPALLRLGVTDGVEDPLLEVFDRSTTLFASNDRWLASDREAFAALGAFPLEEGSADAALVLPLPAGLGTARARATDSGTMLFEFYDPSPTRETGIAHLSARGRVGPGSRALTGGFSVSGLGSKRVLIRALGPQLAQFGVTQALANPNLEVFDQAGQLIAENDNWDPALAPLFPLAGATDLPEGSRDAAVVITVTAGRSYTLAVRRAGGPSGEVLLEIDVLE
ncbi:MAG: immunoglobulin domain-containing protein [Opitutaceae bacterium]|nr:immunoglobulin domain-containing protein [Opitutaceae bacterium]